MCSECRFQKGGGGYHAHPYTEVGGREERGARETYEIRLDNPQRGYRQLHLLTATPAEANAGTPVRGARHNVLARALSAGLVGSVEEFLELVRDILSESGSGQLFESPQLVDEGFVVIVNVFQEPVEFLVGSRVELAKKDIQAENGSSWVSVDRDHVVGEKGQLAGDHECRECIGVGFGAQPCEEVVAVLPACLRR